MRLLLLRSLAKSTVCCIMEGGSSRVTVYWIALEEWVGRFLGERECARMTGSAVAINGPLWVRARSADWGGVKLDCVGRNKWISLYTWTFVEWMNWFALNRAHGVRSRLEMLLLLLLLCRRYVRRGITIASARDTSIRVRERGQVHCNRRASRIHQCRIHRLDIDIKSLSGTRLPPKDTTRLIKQFLGHRLRMILPDMRHERVNIPKDTETLALLNTKPTAIAALCIFRQTLLLHMGLGQEHPAIRDSVGHSV